MTIKGIAELCGVDDTTVLRWIRKEDFLNCKMQLRNGINDNILSRNIRLRNQILEKLDQGSPERPSDYDLEETLAIIGEGGGNKTLATLLAENAANKDKLAIVQPKGEASDLIIKLLEQNNRLMAENQKALEDPRTLAFKELEEFVKSYLEVDEK